MTTETFDFFETSKKVFGPANELGEIGLEAFQKTIQLQLELAGDAMELITDELAVFGEAEGPTDFAKAQGKLATAYAGRAQKRVQSLVETYAAAQQSMLNVARIGFTDALDVAKPKAKPAARKKAA
ncbi:MAG: phasin family protein [Gammaproteobacteria bacterium]